MNIQRVDPNQFTSAYGILCQGTHPWSGASDAPFAATWCRVEPGKVARAHKHQEHEAFFITEGRGLMRVDDEQREVGPGDVIFMAPFSVHELENLDQEHALVFLDLCWEKMEEAIADNVKRLDVEPSRPGRAFITATPPTPNGDFHVGHLSGPYLGADIYARYLRMQGREAVYVTGMDDHQSYVVTKAASLGKAPRDLADQFGETMTGTLEMAKIEVDHIARPTTSELHTRWVQEVFRALWDQRSIVAKLAPTLFCESCKIHLFEAHVDGGCPHCGAASGGNACEACGRPNDCANLVKPRCHHCGEEPVVQEVDRLFFPLAPFEKQLQELNSRVQMSTHTRALCERMIRDGLPDIAVSHPAEWGIPVPVEGYEDQRIYVWFEMAPGYLAASKELHGQRPSGCGGDGQGQREVAIEGTTAWGCEGTQLVQFFGFDNSYFHAVLFPAIFLAYDPEIPLPTAYVTNELYRFEGAKFSTSRGHAMWSRDLLDRVPADVARFYLAYDGPETEPRNFTFEALLEVVRRELANEWDPWLLELGEKLKDSFGGAVPGTGAWTLDHQRFFDRLQKLTHEAITGYEIDTFSPQLVSRSLTEIVRCARRFAKAEDPWRQCLPDRYEEWRTAIALEVHAAKILAQLAAPVMPNFSARLWKDLGFAEAARMPGSGNHAELVPSGQKVSIDRLYFPEIARSE